MNEQSAQLEEAIQGTWWLLSREDRTSEGTAVVDPILGSDPIAILVYANGHFAAQFMKRDRDRSAQSGAASAGENNTAAIDGYDAYFGKYTIDPTTNLVHHTLIGSINPANIGMTVQRRMEVKRGNLIIRLDTTSVEGARITRTLTWKRIK